MIKNNKIKDINEYRKQNKNNYKNREHKKPGHKNSGRKNNKYKRRLKKRRVLLLAILVLGSSVGYICGYSVVAKMKYDIHYLKKDLRKNEIILEGLKARSYENRSVNKMERDAKEKLNMDYPKNNNIEYIDVDY